VLKLLGLLRDGCWKAKFEILAYCVVPDRLILVARGETPESDMREFLRGFRAAATEAFEPGGAHPFWKRKYQERVLRKGELTRTVAQEIFREPVKAGLAKRMEDYPYLGSFSFPREKSGRVVFRD
jgi:REP element-mobilizing transposase RayT